MDTEEEKEIQNEVDSTPAVARFVRIALGTVITFSLLAGGFIYWKVSNMMQEEPAVEHALEDRIGVVDIQKLILVHEDYDKIQSLKEEIKVLEADNDVLHMQMKFTPPEPDKKTFEEAAQQEQNFDRAIELKNMIEEVKQKEADLRQSLKEKFARDLQAIENEYFNEILNIRLKLDNAQEMRLTEDEVDELANKLESLQWERFEAAKKKKQEQDMEIEQAIAGDLAAVQAAMEQYDIEMAEKAQAETLRRETEAQQRNIEAMEKAAVVPMANEIRIAQNKAAIAAKNQQISILKEHILKDIAGLASQHAIANQLTLIVTSSVERTQEQWFEDFEWQPVRMPIIGINTIDLTEALLKDLQEKAEQKKLVENDVEKEAN